MLSIMREKKWISDDPKILRMIEDGHEALKERNSKSSMERPSARVKFESLPCLRKNHPNPRLPTVSLLFS